MNNFLDIANIYTQGMTTNMRKLPALTDVMWYWQGVENRDVKFATPGRIREYICTSPEKAVPDIDTLMHTMYDAVERYYTPQLWEKK